MHLHPRARPNLDKPDWMDASSYALASKRKEDASSYAFVSKSISGTFGAHPTAAQIAAWRTQTTRRSHSLQQFFTEQTINHQNSFQEKIMVDHAVNVSDA